MDQALTQAKGNSSRGKNFSTPKSIKKSDKFFIKLYEKQGIQEVETRRFDDLPVLFRCGWWFSCRAQTDAPNWVGAGWRRRRKGIGAVSVGVI